MGEEEAGQPLPRLHPHLPSQLPGTVLSTLPGTRTVTHVTALIEDASAVWDEMLLQS